MSEGGIRGHRRFLQENGDVPYFPPIFLSPIFLTVALDPVPPGAFVVDPTGTLSLFSFFNGGPATLLAQFPVGGSAIFPVFAVPGTYDLFVTFDSADGNFNSSTSPSITITVL